MLLLAYSKVNFDPNNNQPGGVYIGKSVFDFGLAAAAFPGGYCVTWVQLDNYNQHYGEGGQPPVVSLASSPSLCSVPRFADRLSSAVNAVLRHLWQIDSFTIDPGLLSAYIYTR